MRYWTLLVLGLVAFFLMACAEEAPRPGPLQPFFSACERSNEGELIAVEGYLRLPKAFTPGDTVELLLYQDLHFNSKPIGATMHFGDGPDEAHKISSSYQDEDLQIRLADGMLVHFGTRVRVSGRMYYPITPQEFECGLENLYVESAK